MIKNIILTVVALLFLQSIVLADAIKFVQVADSHFKNKDEYRSKF